MNLVKKCKIVILRVSFLYMIYGLEIEKFKGI